MITVNNDLYLAGIIIKTLYTDNTLLMANLEGELHENLDKVVKEIENKELIINCKNVCLISKRDYQRCGLLMGMFKSSKSSNVTIGPAASIPG